MTALHRAQIIIAVLLTAACSGGAWDAAATQELLRRSALDQAIRDTFDASLRELGIPDAAVSRRMLALDSANAAWLRSAIGARGWPRSAIVGQEVAQAAFLIVQHAPDGGFQSEVLAMLEPLVAVGEVRGEHFALLSDRVAVHAGRPQLYGTQATVRDGRVVLHPIADSAQVDARRARLGLGPLAEYVRLLDSAYGQRPSP